MLTNVNYVASSMLERLNSLMEEEPTLTVFEKMGAEVWRREGTDIAGCTIHADFRLVLTQRVDRDADDDGNGNGYALSGALLDRVVQVQSTSTEAQAKATDNTSNPTDKKGQEGTVAKAEEQGQAEGGTRQRRDEERGGGMSEVSKEQ